MSQKRVPAWLYHPTEAPKLIHDEAEYDQHIEDGWKTTHANFPKKGAKPEKDDDVSDEPPESPFASKAAEKYAADKGIKIEGLKGTGKGGKISIDDLKALG
jgi:pyruvate/2-oxoglutarate dehydrogenase complex dihydrolipoamide acyltransferase (E2) component